MKDQRVVVLHEGLWYTGWVLKPPTLNPPINLSMTIAWDEGGKYVVDRYYRQVFPINDADWPVSSQGYTWEEIKPYLLVSSFLKISRVAAQSRLDSLLNGLELTSPLKVLTSVWCHALVWHDHWGTADIHLAAHGDYRSVGRSLVTNVMHNIYATQVAPKLEPKLKEIGFTKKVSVADAIPNIQSSGRVTLTIRYMVADQLFATTQEAKPF